MGMEPVCDVLVGATVLVGSVDQVGSELMGSLGWAEIASGPLEESAAAELGLDPAGRTKSVVIGESGSGRGMLRLVEGTEAVGAGPGAEGIASGTFGRGPTRPTRPSGPGAGPEGGRGGFARGFSGVELVVRDVDGLYRRIQERPLFTTMKEPFTIDLTGVGSNQHRAFVVRVAAGLYIAFTMALTQPEGREFPSGASEVGPIFAVHCRTDDRARFHRHYVGELGFRTFLEMEMTEGFLHDLWELEPGTETTLDLIKGDGEGTGHGSIEVQGYPRGLLGAPGRGPGRILSVTYTAAGPSRGPGLAGPGVVRGPEGELVEVAPAPWGAGR